MLGEYSHVDVSIAWVSICEWVLQLWRFKRKIKEVKSNFGMLTDDCIEFKFLGISFSFYVSTAHTHVCQYTQRERFIPTNPDKLSTNGQHILHLMSILCRCDELFCCCCFLQSFDEFVNSLQKKMRNYQVYQNDEILRKRNYMTTK